MLKDTFGAAKPIIAMAHFTPLPGSPGYDAKRGMAAVIDWVARRPRQAAGRWGRRRDVRQRGRPSLPAESDAGEPGGHGDRHRRAQARPQGPFGVNYLWDPVATVALGVATGARFGREIFTGVYASDMGLWAPDCARGVASCARSRSRRLQAAVQYQCRVRGTPGHAADREARDQRRILVVGRHYLRVRPMTGQAVDNAELTRVKKAVKDTPVFANTGVNIENVRDILGVADGCVIGTHFKVDGNTWNAVDGDRVKRFMDVVHKLR
jgi:predicted TIM-barrel enzyme